MEQVFQIEQILTGYCGYYWSWFASTNQTHEYLVENT